MRLKLVRGSDCLQYDTSRYMTLSYCWGGPQQNQLTLANLNSYEIDIPWDDLPNTLKDAVIATDRLGGRYLWIDSLCIIQNDDNDKAREIGLMAKVYTHSMLTIVAGRGDRASDGFLHMRVLPSGTTKFLYQHDDGKQGHVISIFPEIMTHERKYEIDSRGWTMQEYILSPRLVIFGTWTTEWTCRARGANPAQRHYKDGWHPPFLPHPQTILDYSPKWNPSIKNVRSAHAITNRSIQSSRLLDAAMFFSANPSFDHPRPDFSTVFDTWNDLIDLYTCRLLSDPKDRILAISGLAERFASLLSPSERYAAGLWESDLLCGLNWRCKSGYSSPRPKEYQGPSWSWVSVNEEVWTSSPIDSPTTVLSCDCVVSDPSAPYGAVDSATLRIEGPSRSVEWRYEQQDGWPNCPDIFEWRQRENGRKFGYHMDLDARENNTHWTEVILLVLEYTKDGSPRGLVLIRDQEHQWSLAPAAPSSSGPRAWCAAPYRRLGHFYGSQGEKWTNSVYTIV
ncbi:unnamed protein product [Clonostachys rosea]|uniref:Heterokaryon incompatibility domain-containing protein n=1 Tax=Bionectria ochroleuca TaxID=29856 RepID=A0ABY6V4Z4_BIOOC|nr:unnamed protein product [Clonostachys rosea]